jgi:hypothetical protein
MNFFVAIAAGFLKLRFDALAATDNRRFTAAAKKGRSASLPPDPDAL